MDDYILLETLNESSLNIDGTKEIIKHYLEHQEDYADPIMCKNDHLIGKVFVPESNSTLFWIDLLDVKYFFDIQIGKV